MRVTASVRIMRGFMDAFPHVVGHTRARQVLADAIRAGRFGGTLLLAGPTGVGRRLLAHELAKALNCQGQGPQLPCGSCGPCGRIERGKFPDLVVLEPGDNASASIGIEQVRELLDELALAPVEGRRRVFVIDPASALTEPAQHALLKGLEEPPERAVMILIAEGEDELLDTVVSRCRVLRLQRLSTEDVERVLVAAGRSTAEASARARWSGGSPGNAQLDDALALGKAARGLLDGLVSGAAYADPMAEVARLQDYVDRDADAARVRRERLRELIRVVAWSVRDGLLAAVDPQAERLGGADDEVVAAFSSRPSRRLEAALDRLNELDESVTQNVNPTLVLEGLVIDLGQSLAPAAAR